MGLTEGVEVDFSLLDVPRAAAVLDPDAYLRTAMAWHFGADTGSRFWLRAAGDLDFDPLTDITTFDDLRRFPNLLGALRDAPVEELIPAGYPGTALPQIFESGGTTGAPKRTVQLPDWVEQVIRWQTEDFASGGFVAGRGFLCMMPSGPHGVGFFSRMVAGRLGSIFHAIDLDPRWVKTLAARGGGEQIPAYVEHVIGQARFILTSQDVANLHCTPPLLEAIAEDDALVDLVNAKVRYILLSGAHVDLDTLDLLRGIFCEASITMAFGSTMILSQAVTRARSGHADPFVFDPRSPYAVFWVVDPESGEPVPYGQRGQVVMNHVSRGMFIPNNLERDTAVRVPGPPGQVGDSVSEVAPAASFEGAPVYEGVY
ncbi:phenylacetate--CoA ligase family protein [Mycolicibacterium palauense]|uniref:AMP-binding protein n=1 Tax=Mycolicibacterium palauense TaxID=2034511 RepID=UPI000BFEFF11|nr:AMP-binding protein [Mycolicibacterium palauense]